MRARGRGDHHPHGRFPCALVRLGETGWTRRRRGVRGEDAVRHELAAPATAQFLHTEVRKLMLSEDDHVGLGFDADRVASMWSVTGDVESRTRSQTLAATGFACRAALFDNGTIRASVTYGADLAEQRALRP